MTYLTCPRSGNITEAQCSQIVLATTDAAAYGVCLACKHGIAKAADSPIRPHNTRHAASMSLHEASLVLPRTVRFVLDNYPSYERMTLGFLAQVARRFGFDGGPLPLALAAREARLELASHGGHQALVVTDAARSYARAQA